MPKVQYKQATSYSLLSLDQEKVLFDSSNVAGRRLVAEDEELPQQIKLSFQVDGETHERTLNKGRGAFSEGTRLVALIDGEEEELEMPETFAYRADDMVLTINGAKFNALLFDDASGRLVHLLGEDANLNVNTDAAEFFGRKLNLSRRSLGESKDIDYWGDCHSGQSKGLGTVKMGAAIGTMMWNNYGDKAVDEVNDYITLSNDIYERQMDISLEVDTVVIDKTGSSSWAMTNCNQMTISTQLQRFRNDVPSPSRPLWHLYDDCFGFSGSTLGIAYVGTLCSSSANVGVSYMSAGLSEVDYPTWATVAHEIGHNFDAQHSFEDGQGRTGGIMDYGPLPGKLIDGDVQFNTEYRKREVCNKVNSAVSRSCVTYGSEQQAGEEEVETSEFERTSELRPLSCVKHTHRVVAALDHLQETRSGFTQAQCRVECEKRNTCDGFTYGKDGYCELWQGKNVDSLVFSSDYNTFFCAEGDAPSGRQAEASVDDLLQDAEAQELIDQCCEQLDQKTFLGLNTVLREDYTQALCEEECVKNSQCSASTFDVPSGQCMLYGGVDFSNELLQVNGMFSLSCSRTCIDGKVLRNGSNPSADSTTIAAGSLLGGGALLSIGAAAYTFYHRSKGVAGSKKVKAVDL